MKWIQEEKSSRTGTRGSFGYYNVGMFLSPASLSTQTADTAEETTGADVQVQFGLTF